VARVATGQAGIVTVDAFPDAELSGEVVHVAPVATMESGVVLYPVTVRLDPAGMNLRAGMTADVEIVIDVRENVLIVPLRAVHIENGRAYVDVLSGRRQVVRVEVEMGMMTETEVEIAGGLSEGDVVVVVAGAAQEDQGGFLPFRGGGPMGGGNGGRNGGGPFGP
jgi:multidrug efflux pump subunit AcrA (membrane-fusion protein)